MSPYDICMVKKGGSFVVGTVCHNFQGETLPPLTLPINDSSKSPRFSILNKIQSEARDKSDILSSPASTLKVMNVSVARDPKPTNLFNDIDTDKKISESNNKNNKRVRDTSDITPETKVWNSFDDFAKSGLHNPSFSSYNDSSNFSSQSHHRKHTDNYRKVFKKHFMRPANHERSEQRIVPIHGASVSNTMNSVHAINELGKTTNSHHNDDSTMKTREDNCCQEYKQANMGSTRSPVWPSFR